MPPAGRVMDLPGIRPMTSTHLAAPAADHAPGVTEPAAPVFVLRPARPDRRVPTVLLTPGRYVIGSDPESTVRLEVPGVRPRHCLIVVGPSRTVVRAYDARTWLNDFPVTEASLSAGDRLTIGPVELHLTADLPAAAEGPIAQTGHCVISPAAERLLEELQEHQPAGEGGEVEARRPSEHLLRRENDAVLATALVADAARRTQERDEELRDLTPGLNEGAKLRTPDTAEAQEEAHRPAAEKQLARGRAELGRRQRLLNEVLSELAESHRDLLGRERSVRQRTLVVESRLAALASAEAEQRRELAAVSAERDTLRQERAKVETERAELEQRFRELARKLEEADRRDRDVADRAAELDVRTRDLDRRGTDLDRRAAGLAAREETAAAASTALSSERAAVEADRQTLTAEREKLAAERVRLVEERESLQAERNSLRREAERLEAWREEVKAAAAILESERVAFENRRADPAARTAAFDEAADLASRHEAEEAALDAEWDRLREAWAEAADREAIRAAAEVEVAWQLRDLEHQTADLRLLSAELDDRSAVLDRREADHACHQLPPEPPHSPTPDAELPARHADVERRAAELAEQEQAAADRERSLAQREATLVGRKSELDARAAAVADRRAELDRRADELADTVAGFEIERATFTMDRKAFSARATELATEQERLASEAARLEAEADRLAEERTHLAEERKSVTAGRIAVEQEQARLTAARAAFAAEQAAFAERQQSAGSERTELTAERGRLEEAQDRLAMERQSLADERAALVAEREASEVERRRVKAEREELHGERERLEEARRELDSKDHAPAEEARPAVHHPSAEELANIAAARAELEEQQARLAVEQTRLASERERLAEERVSLAEERSRLEEQRREERRQPAETHASDVAYHRTQALPEDAPVFVPRPTDAVEPADDGPAEDGAALALRERLAAMFDLSADSFAAARQDVVETAEPADAPAVSHASPRDGEVEANEPEPLVLPGIPTPETPAPEIPVPAAIADEVTAETPAHDESHPDSVAKYMEQLLARVRQSNPAVPPPATSASEFESDSGVTGTATDAAEPLRVGPVIPKRVVDKDELRAQTSSLREVANRSARVAIAKSSRRRGKTELTAKGVLTVLTLGIAGLLSGAVVVTKGEFLWQAVGAFATAAVVGHDLVRSVRRFRRHAVHDKPEGRRRKQAKAEAAGEPSA